MFVGSIAAENARWLPTVRNGLFLATLCFLASLATKHRFWMFKVGLYLLCLKVNLFLEAFLNASKGGPIKINGSKYVKQNQSFQEYSKGKLVIPTAVPFTTMQNSDFS